MWMAQIYTRPVVEARLMEQESLDICLCRFSRHMKKKKSFEGTLFFKSPFALNVCKNDPGQYTNTQTLTK